VTLAIAALMILACAAVIARPLLHASSLAQETQTALTDELLEREKNAALLAIREADFDRAMGKLSDEDHASLLGIYQQRALGAMNALERTHEPGGAASSQAAESDRALFCVKCGVAFGNSDKFCTGCGSARSHLVRAG